MKEIKLKRRSARGRLEYLKGIKYMDTASRAVALQFAEECLTKIEILMVYQAIKCNLHKDAKKAAEHCSICNVRDFLDGDTQKEEAVDRAIWSIRDVIYKAPEQVSTDRFYDILKETLVVLEDMKGQMECKWSEES